MPSPSPTIEGFRAAFRRPSITVAEIAWRWTVGAVATVLFLFAGVEFLDTLPVARGDAALLRTQQPFLVGRAIARILQGSLTRAVLAALVAVLALSLLWIAAASLGRLATIRALLDYFDARVDGDVFSSLPAQSTSFRLLVPLQWLRVAAVLAALLACAGAALLASFVSSQANARPGAVVAVGLPLAGVIVMAWSMLNWLLGLAGIFVVRDGEDALGAFSSAVDLFRERLGPVCAVSAWTGLAHLVAFSIVTSAVAVPVAFVHLIPARLVFAVITLLTLGYFAVADWIYIARLAGYLYVAEMPDALISAGSSPVPPSAGEQFEPSSRGQTTIDRDEPILSDILTLYTGNAI